jgi:hypothetical protein
MRNGLGLARPERPSAWMSWATLASRATTACSRLPADVSSIRRSRGAVEERHTQVGLELLHPFGNRGLTEVQQPRGHRHIPLLGDFQKALQLVVLHVSTSLGPGRRREVRPISDCKHRRSEWQTTGLGSA